MKKILINLLFVSTALFGVSGQEVYETHCASCHQMQGMMNSTQMKAMREKMQNASMDEKKVMKAKMKKKMQEHGMKAPAMQMVSMRLKKMTDSKEMFIVFVKDYIQNPSQAKGFCMPMAYKRFGVMPPIGKGLSDAEREAVAIWLYDTFEGSWDESMGAKSCEQKSAKTPGSQKRSGMKCGSK